MPLSMLRTENCLSTAVATCALAMLCSLAGLAQSSPIARVIGTVTKIDGNSITIASDSNGEVKADLSPSVRLLRVAAGEKDLRNATSITVRDLQPGDRVLVRGRNAADVHTINALAVIVMKQGDVSEKRQRDKEDWQRRGVAGLVAEVDAGQGTITLSSGGLGSRNIVVHTTKTTSLRRYAPDSTRFDDAKAAPLEQIKPGDQMLARGDSSADGTSMTAQEVVSGTFRNIAGTITAVDAANQTVTVQDVIKKGAVQIKVSADSQIKKIPSNIAQRIALRLKAEPGDSNGAGKSPAASSPFGADSHAEAPGLRGQSEGRNNRGTGDLQRLLARLPGSSLADLHQGDSVMVVATLGEASGSVRAITVLAGVEPILAAAPSRSASAALSAWTLSGPTMEGAEP